MNTSDKSSILLPDSSHNQIPLIESTAVGLRFTKIRWVALILACLNLVGPYFCFDNPQALQTIIKKQLELSSFEFNLLYSVYAFPNIILPFFGGLIIDRFGVRLGIAIFSFLPIIGQTVFTFGTARTSFVTMLIGRILFGFGGESLNVASSVIITKWFVEKELAFALGVTLCVAKLGSSLNSFLSPKIYIWTNNLYSPLLLGAILCILSWISGLSMNYLDKKADLQEGVSNQNESQKTNFRDLKKLEKIFYLLLVNGFILYGGFYGLNNNLNDLMVQRFGFSPENAGNYIPIIYICAAVIIPIFGIYTDYKGKRVFFMIISTVIFVIDHLFIAFLPSATPGTVNYAIIGPLFGVGIFYATYGAIYWPCIPLVVNENVTGAAFGITTCLQNLMLAVIPMILGAIHDATEGYMQGYFWTEITLAILVGFGVLITIWIYFEDLRTGRRLDRPASNEEQRKSLVKSRSRSFM